MSDTRPGPRERMEWLFRAFGMPGQFALPTPKEAAAVMVLAERIVNSIPIAEVLAPGSPEASVARLMGRPQREWKTAWRDVTPAAPVSGDGERGT